MLDRKENVEMTGGINMAVFAKPANHVIILTEKAAKKILSSPVDTKQIERIRKEAERFKNNNVKRR